MTDEGKSAFNENKQSPSAFPSSAPFGGTFPQGKAFFFQCTRWGPNMQALFSFHIFARFCGKFSPLLPGQQRPGHVVRPQAGGIHRLGEGVAVAAHLHQQGAGEQLLVIPAVAQDDGPGQLAIAPG